MVERKDGGAAFPGTTSPKACDLRQLRDDLGVGLYDLKALLSHHGGMSLRAWLTGQALSGLVANANLMDHLNEGDDITDGAFARSVANGAVALADAALSALDEDA